jgi:hypothetical protein
MSKLIRAGAITVAIFSGVSFAAAQGGPGSNRADLTPTQQRVVSQGLATSPSQPAPASAQPQVGDKLPDSMSAQALPGDVANQVPEAKQLMFVKLPDRILLIDPNTKLVTELVMDDATTGSNPNRSDQPSR